MNTCTLCLVTYLRAGEVFTPAQHSLCMALWEQYHSEFKAVVIGPMSTLPSNVPYCITGMSAGGTKYSRLCKLITTDRSQYYLSIDNDITGNSELITKWIQQLRQQDADIGWGRIHAAACPGLISGMVAVDKLLSHHLIRPFLWCIGAGISVPGQLFCFKGETYRLALPDIDTFLDDLAIGLTTNRRKFKRHTTNDVLALENPNTSLKGLLKQRIRWAKGYADVICASRRNAQHLALVLTHGICYHLLWLVHWGACILAFHMHWGAGIAFLALLPTWVAQYSLKKGMLAILYQAVFPLFHAVWICATLVFLANSKNLRRR